jgi:hypothetical protein
MNRIAIAVLSGAWCTLVAAPAAAQDKVGVETCDAFIAKYEACLTAKLPAASQPAAMDGIKQMRTMWKSMASQPSTKDQLSGLCQQTADAIKQQTASLGCQW